MTNTTNLHTDLYIAIEQAVVGAIKAHILPLFTPQLAPTENPVGIQEASQITSLEVGTIYQKTSKGEIPHYKQGGKLRFLPSELRAWMLQTVQ